jgi:hypothetical protein
MWKHFPVSQEVFPKEEDVERSIPERTTEEGPSISRGLSVCDCDCVCGYDACSIGAGRLRTGDANERVPPFSLAGGSGRATANIQPNGTFKIQVPSGEYRITPSALPAGYYLQSFMMGSIDLSQAPLKLEGAAPGEIVVTLAIQHP